MDNIKNTIRFWGMVIGASARFSILFAEIRGATTSIVKGLLLNILAYLGIGALTAKPIEIIQIIYWLGLLMLGRFVLGLFYFPAKFYSDKKSLSNKYSWRDIEIRLFRFPLGSGFGVGLEIVSNKPKNSYDNVVREYMMDGCNVVLEKITHESIVEHPRVQIPLLMGSTTFVETDSIINRRDLRKGQIISNVAVAIADCDDEIAWITKKDKQKDLLIKRNCIYQLQIEFRDTRLEMGPMMEGLAIWCDLRYYKGTDKKMRIDIDNLKRNIEYDP